MEKIDAQSTLSRVKAWFEDYILQFYSDDPKVQENIDLKVEHTRRVCKAILDIGGSLNLSKEDLCIAEVSGLLHDIGRFEQYRRYRTFMDYKSEDHATLGKRVLKENGALDGTGSDIAEMIIGLVAYHNRITLPVGKDNRFLFFLKLLRDADKVDIWHVVTDYYQKSGNNRNPTIELDLPDVDRVSDSVYEALLAGKAVKMSDLETLNDFKLLQIGWIYDIHFPRTFEIVRERGYLEMILDALPQGPTRVKEIYKKARMYLDLELERN